MGSVIQWLCSRVAPCHHWLCSLQGLQVGMLVNNVGAYVFWGRVGRPEALISAWVHTVRVCMYKCSCLCDGAHMVAYIVLQTAVSNLLPFSSSVSPSGLSSPAVHSCEKQCLAERDICSVRECPNYSWPFNHSVFGLRGICGVSHRRTTATLVNGSFIAVVLYFCTSELSQQNTQQSCPVDQLAVIKIQVRIIFVFVERRKTQSKKWD